MKKVIAASVMAMALATGASAEVKVGLGYEISGGLFSGGDIDGSSAYSYPASIRVPIDFDFGLRIEPELGFGTGVYTTNLPDGEETTRTGMTLAVGGYYNLWKVEKVNFYAGGRLALISGTDETTYTDGSRTQTTDFDATSLQGLFGAEYMFTEDFSFSAQAGLEFATGSEGNADFTTNGTVAHLLVHYFF